MTDRHVLVYAFTALNFEYRFHRVSICVSKSMSIVTCTSCCARLVGRNYQWNMWGQIRVIKRKTLILINRYFIKTYTIYCFKLMLIDAV